MAHLLQDFGVLIVLRLSSTQVYNGRCQEIITYFFDITATITCYRLRPLLFRQGTRILLIYFHNVDSLIDTLTKSYNR